MKVYTEIVYTWDDEKSELVEQSSKSFEYEGEITLCDKKWYRHNHAVADALGVGDGGDNSYQQAADELGEGNVQDVLEGGLDSYKDTLSDPIGSVDTILAGNKEVLEQTGVLDVIREGPGGDIGKAVDAVYGGDFKNAVGSAQRLYRDLEGGANYYKENFNRDRTSTSGDLDENGDGDGDGTGEGDGMTPEERDALSKQGLVQGGGNVGKRGRKYHTTGSSRGTVLSPA